MMGKAGYRDLKIIYRSIEYDIVVIRFGWVAKTKDEYVEIVCNWVRNLGELAELR